LLVSEFFIIGINIGKPPFNSPVPCVIRSYLFRVAMSATQTRGPTIHLCPYWPSEKQNSDAIH